MVPSAQGLGQAAGPSIAAFVLGQGGGYFGVMTMCAIASLMAMIIYSFVYFSFKRNAPEVAST